MGGYLFNLSKLMAVANIIYNPLFREALLLVAVVGLIVFCIDKSRQNKRTRQTLYNCIYPLYGAAAVKAVQFLEHAIGYTWIYVVAAFLLLVVAVLAYWRLLPPQSDIAYNRPFRIIGWLVLAVAFGLVLFELLMCPPSQ